MQSRCKSLIIFMVLIAIMLVVSTQHAYSSLTATQVVKKMDKLMRGKTSQSDSDMTVINPNWKRTISMKSWSKGTDYFFIHITAPARESGTTFLKKNKLMYQWVPSAEMRIKITPSMMLQAWMGSDFTNDDLVKESSMVKDYTHKFLGKEKVDGVECYKIECLPKPAAPVVWGKLILWIREKNFVPARTNYYDEKGNHIKSLSFTNVKKVNDRMFPMTMTMIPLNKKGHKTIVNYNSIKFNVKLSPSVFTFKNLEKPR
ncbi:MAG: outer membrane lipoprotein-sorting protein [Candidatus Eremiobacteraeota bacterium]|nr:outer membrane lipoprotein-sorting protein [Candidatus Eremiobacteraeota bacterium]